MEGDGERRGGMEGDGEGRGGWWEGREKGRDGG